MSTYPLRHSDAQLDCTPEPGSFQSLLGDAFLERLETLLDASLRHWVAPQEWEETRSHLADCGELLAASLQRDCAALNWTVSQAACERAYTLGVAMAALQLSIPRTASPIGSGLDDSGCAAEAELRRRRAFLVRTLDLTRDGSLDAARDDFPERAIRCLLALTLDLAGVTESAPHASPVLLLARVYEELLRDGRTEGHECTIEPALRRLRLLTPLRALAYARHGMGRTTA